MIIQATRALGAALLLAGTSMSALAANRVPTATLAIPIISLASGTDLGAVPSSQPVTVRLGLRLRNPDGLVAAVQQGRTLTPAQLLMHHAPTQTEIGRVTSFLAEAGFTNIVVEPNGLLISADGTAGQAETAFGTTLENVSFAGGSGFINTTAATVPAAIGKTVGAVLGLNSIGQWRSTVALPGPQYLDSFTPPQFQTIYSATDAPVAKKSAIAIMAEGDLTQVIADLRTAETAFGVPQVPVQVVQVGLPSPDVSGADEWDLDTQYSSGMAETLKKLYVYDTTSLSDSDLALEISRWSSDNLARAASASLGECEIFPFLDGSMLVDDEIFLESAAQGQTFFASSGDTGSFCPIGPAGVNGVPAGAPFVNYPAASPYVVGVGGTTLLVNADGSYDTETAWATGGGGVSQFEGAPNWQSAAVSVLGTSGFRGVPDVAMDADPNSGAVVYVDGTVEVVGGTSLSSPLALGVFARVLTNNPRVGNGGPALYSLYDGQTTPGSYPVGGYHDITIGTNGLYDALPGYDLTTGLGTFIVDQLVADLPRKTK